MAPTCHECATLHLTALLIGSLALAYLFLWCALAGLPFQDVPNHLARAIVIGDLLFDGGRRFGEQFTFHWLVAPYILGDLLTVPLARWLPADVAGRVLVVIEWVSLPLAVAALLKSWRASRVALAIGVLLSLYLATDVFFMMGFVNFRLAVALVLLALAAWELGLRTRAPGWWAAFYVLAFAGYLMHLSALVFLVAAVGSLSALRLLDRRERLLPLLAAGLPLVALLAWHVLGAPPLGDAPPLQPTALRKLYRLLSPLLRFRDVPDTAIALGCVALVGFAVARRSIGRLDDRERELAVLVAAFVGIYIVLPEIQGEIWAIDNRALAMAWVCGALFVAWSAPALGARRVLAAAAVLAAANVALLATRLEPDDVHMREYRALATDVPRGAVVLPVVTQPRRGYLNPTAHAASFATIDRDAVVPYTFSGNVGMPMKYFRFRQRPPAPQQFWYQSGAGLEGDEPLLGTYRYLLVELPVDWSRIPIDGRVVRQNAAVALVETRSRLAEARSAAGSRGGG